MFGNVTGLVELHVTRQKRLSAQSVQVSKLSKHRTGSGAIETRKLKILCSIRGVGLVSTGLLAIANHAGAGGGGSASQRCREHATYASTSALVGGERAIWRSSWDSHSFFKI